MAAPENTWEFVYDLWGDRVPKTAVLKANASLDTKVGTLVTGDGGVVKAATASAKRIIGIALEKVTGATANDPIKVAIIAPGMVIRGTASADASAVAGFKGTKFDVTSAGALDVSDAANGCLSVFRVVSSDGKTVDCIVHVLDGTV